MQSKELRAKLEAEGLGWIYESQLARLATPPADPENIRCWLNFLSDLFETGNIHTAVMSLIKCLMGQKLRGEDFIGCVMTFILGLLKGEAHLPLLLDLALCLLGTLPPPDEPSPPGELEPPNYREVDRCG